MTADCILFKNRQNQYKPHKYNWGEAFQSDTIGFLIRSSRARCVRSGMDHHGGHRGSARPGGPPFAPAGSSGRALRIARRQCVCGGKSGVSTPSVVPGRPSLPASFLPAFSGTDHLQVNGKNHEEVYQVLPTTIAS